MVLGFFGRGGEDFSEIEQGGLLVKVCWETWCLDCCYGSEKFFVVSRVGVL